MELYLHSDRSTELKEGDILRNTVYPKSNHVIGLLCPLIDPHFVNNIIGIYEKGISYHGHAYLVSPVGFNNWAIEIYFEYIRYKEFPHMPSRFQCVFGWEDINDAIEFNGTSPIFQIASESGHHKADMNLLGLDPDPVVKHDKAAKYWKGEPMSNDAHYKPVWEYVINTPVTVLNRIKL